MSTSQLVNAALRAVCFRTQEVLNTYTVFRLQFESC